MQKIFYNGKIMTNKGEFPQGEAMLVNDESVVYVGRNEDVLNLKTAQTKLYNLDEKYVYPTKIAFGCQIFEQIDEKIKNAKQGRNFQIPADINENYENFSNFEEYKKEYVLIEKDIISKGITTVIETGVNRKSFAFWKRMSEEKLLKIDIVGYVDLIENKSVMNDNCVTYRKSRFGFRLAGYSVCVDGDLADLKAWLRKPYKGSKTYNGSSFINGEQFYYLCKSVIEEKKQLLFFADGDKALSEIFSTLSDIESKEKIDNFFRPLIVSSGFVSKQFYEKIIHFDVGLLIRNLDEKATRKIKKELGFIRSKDFLNFRNYSKFNLKFSFLYNDGLNFLNLNYFKKKRKMYQKTPKNSNFTTNYLDFLRKIIYLDSAYFIFDQDKKCVLETEKQASFFVSKEENVWLNNCPINPLNVYIKGEEMEF